MKQARFKRIIVSVTNDISTDNRVHKVCNTLMDLGFEVLLVGRKLPHSHLLKQRKYKTLRFHLLINKGPLFYVFYNFRLFLFLMSTKVDLLLSNDLDTLPANFMVSFFKKKPLVYDSHEFFTEVPELVGRPVVKKMWELLERFMVPRVQHAYTVCNSIASVYSGKYRIPFHVIRNVPYTKALFRVANSSDEIPIILYQGALNAGRGLNQVISAMNYLDGVRLVIAGSGDLAEELKYKVIRENLEGKVEFLGRIPFEELFEITAGATIGLSIEEDIGLNYKYALPNKLFDYIQARVPVLVTNRPEMAAIVRQYDIGEVTDDLTPIALAGVLKDIISDHSRLSVWKSNLERAARELVWEKEEAVLQEIFKKYI